MTQYTRRAAPLIAEPLILLHPITIHSPNGDIPGNPGDLLVTEGDNHRIMTRAQFEHAYEAVDEPEPTDDFVAKQLEQVLKDLEDVKRRPVIIQTIERYRDYPWYPWHPYPVAPRWWNYTLCTASGATQSLYNTANTSLVGETTTIQGVVTNALSSLVSPGLDITKINVADHTVSRIGHYKGANSYLSVGK